MCPPPLGGGGVCALHVSSIDVYLGRAVPLVVFSVSIIYDDDDGGEFFLGCGKWPKNWLIFPIFAIFSNIVKL